MKRLFSFSSLRSKIMLASVLCILLPVYISLIVYNSMTRVAVQEQAMSNAQESLRLVEGYVSKSLKSMLDAANFIQLDSEMNVLLKEAASEEGMGSRSEYEQFDIWNRISTRMDSLSVVGGDKLFISIVLTNGEAFANYPTYEYDPKKLYEESWSPEWSQLIGYQSYWIKATPTVFFTEKARNPYQISVARTLRTGSGGVYGYAIVTLLENQINPLFEKMAAGQEIMILDKDRSIISHANSNKIGTLFEYAQPAQAEPSSNIVNMEDRDYLVTSIPLPFAGWDLVSLRPYAEAAHKINSIFSQVFTFQLLFIALFLILLLSLLGKFTSPLVRLGQVVKKVEMGNLEIRSNIRGVDEVGRLGRSFDQMLERIKEMIVEISITQNRKREAEMAMLQAQINPHFLFNVLNSIRMKILRNGDKQSAAMLTSLSRLLRITIDPKKENISFFDEVEIVTDYVQLMNMRQRERAELEFELEGPPFKAVVPRFFLQPIIENAMIHGLNQRSGLIRIRAVRKGSFYVVSVSDDGVGMEKEQLQELRNKLISGGNSSRGKANGFSSIGLTNVNERMKMQFGPDYDMHIQSELGEGTVVTMYIPYREEEQFNV